MRRFSTRSLRFVTLRLLWDKTSNCCQLSPSRSPSESTELASPIALALSGYHFIT